MNKTALTIFSVGLVITLIVIFSARSSPSAGVPKGEVLQNVEVKDGFQYITIQARGGYSPKVSTAQAGIPTKLIMKTNGTYDCSASLVIKALNFQKILEQTGEEVIDLGTPKVGEPIRGVCGMGMYSFTLNFQ